MKSQNNYSTALVMRMEGKTYGEIRKALGIAKSTQSSWFKNLNLSDETRRILKEKQGNGIRALHLFNTHRTRLIQQENEEIRKAYEAQIKDLNKRELMLVGASLYWAEGYKNFKTARGDYPYLGFSNSDPYMITIFISFLEKILKIPTFQMRGEVHIYPQQSFQETGSYWQKITKIPLQRIKVYTAVSRASRNKRPKNLLPYGTFYLKIRRRKEFFKIKGMIDGIIKTLNLHFKP